SDCRDCSRSCAILVTSPYRPQRTTKALAIRCVIVDMGLPPSMPIGVNSPTIEHISREIVHRLPPESPPLEKVPFPIEPKLTSLVESGYKSPESPGPRQRGRRRDGLSRRRRRRFRSTAPYPAATNSRGVSKPRARRDNGLTLYILSGQRHGSHPWLSEEAMRSPSASLYRLPILNGSHP